MQCSKVPNTICKVECHSGDSSSQLEACQEVLRQYGYEPDVTPLGMTRVYLSPKTYGRVYVSLFSRACAEDRRIRVFASRMFSQRPDVPSLKMEWESEELDSEVLGQVLQVVTGFYSLEP